MKKLAHIKASELRVIHTSNPKAMSPTSAGYTKFNAKTEYGTVNTPVRNHKVKLNPLNQSVQIKHKNKGS